MIKTARASRQNGQTHLEMLSMRIQSVAKRASFSKRKTPHGWAARVTSGW